MTTKFLWLDGAQLIILAPLAALVAGVAIWEGVKKRYQVRKASVFIEKYLKYLEADYRGDEFRKKLKILRQREPEGSAHYTSEFVDTLQAVTSYDNSSRQMWNLLKIEINNTQFLIKSRVLELMHQELSSKIVHKFTNEMYELSSSRSSHLDPLLRDLQHLITHEEGFYEAKIFK